LVRRNKVVFIAAAAVAAALIVGLGTSTWLFFKEREAHQRAVAAEEKQARLTAEAESARANEATLLRQAEAREKMTQAEILVSEGKFDEVNRLIGRTPSSQPSVEEATILRSLGEWQARQGQWAQAADRFGLLVQADELDGWDRITLDVLAYGVSLVERGEMVNYDQFRRVAIACFASTTNSVIAERIVKISLLKPADKNTAEATALLARVAQNSFATFDSTDSDAVFRAAWCSLSLALWEYRQGHFARSIDWARRCLAFPDDNAPRAAAAHLELALAFSQSGQKDEALRELTQGRQAMADKFNGIMEEGSATQGFWFDWVFARILLREATTLVDSPAPARARPITIR
jgi:tetratricopeptide (TPR) repeat protein